MKTIMINFESKGCKECEKKGFYNPIIHKEDLCNEHYDAKHQDEGVN